MIDRMSEWDREGEKKKRKLEEKGVEKGNSEGRRAERREGGGGRERGGERARAKKRAICETIIIPLGLESICIYFGKYPHCSNFLFFHIENQLLD